MKKKNKKNNAIILCYHKNNCIDIVTNGDRAKNE